MSETCLQAGITLCDAVSVAGGNYVDIERVLKERHDFFVDMGAKLVELSRQIQGDADCFHFTDEAVVFKIPALKRPTADEIRANFGEFKSYDDQSTEEPVMLRLATLLKTDESSINGATYERRLAKFRTNGTILGKQHLDWMVAHQDDPQAIPDAEVRAALKTLVGNAYVDFSALIVVITDDDQIIPCADDDGEQLYADKRWLSDDFNQLHRVAVADK